MEEQQLNGEQPQLLPSVSQLITQSCDLLRLIFAKLVLAGLFALVPIIVTIIVCIALMSIGGTVGTALAVVAGIVGVLITIHVSIRIGIITTHLLYGDTTGSLRQYWQSSGEIWWKVLVRSIAYNLMINGGMVLLVIPGIIMTLALGYTLPVYVLRDKPQYASFYGALARSRGMTSGARGGLFWRLVLLSVIPFIVIITLALFVAKLVPGAGLAIAVALLVVVAAMVLLILACARAVMYKHLDTARPDASKPVTKPFVITFILLGIIGSLLNTVSNIAKLAGGNPVVQSDESQLLNPEFPFDYSGDTIPEIQQGAEAAFGGVEGQPVQQEL